MTEYKSPGNPTILLGLCLSRSSTYQTNTSFENYNYKMCCFSYNPPSSPHLKPSNKYPKYYEVQRPPKARTYQMEYAPHVKKPERKYTHEAQRHPNVRRQNEECVPRGRKPEATHYSNRGVSPLSTGYRQYNSRPISPMSTSDLLPPNTIIPNRFDTLSVVSSLQSDHIQPTRTVRPTTPKLRAPRARLAQTIDRPANNTPSCKPVISRPPPAAVHESNPRPPLTINLHDYSAQASTKHRLSRPWNDMTECPPAHNPDRLSKPFSDMPAFYRVETPPPLPTIAQRRREKKKKQVEKQEHLLWHGVRPPRKDSPFVEEKLRGRQDVWYYQTTIGDR